MTHQPNLRVLFWAKVVTVRAFARDCSRIVCCSDLPADDEEVVVVKHYSAILDIWYEESVQSVLCIIDFTKSERMQRETGEGIDAPHTATERRPE